MKKVLAYLAMLLLFSGCDNCRYETVHIKIGECSFDGQTITFYEAQTRRGQMLTGTVFYYCTESSKEQQADVLTSKDGTLRMFVDFNGNEEVLNASGVTVEPATSFEAGEQAVQVYILDASEVHEVRFSDRDDYSFHFSDESGQVSMELNLEKLQNEVEGWTKLEDCPEDVPAAGFDLFLQITKYRREIGEQIRTWDFGKAELDDGRWVVFLREDEREYYLLDTNQVESLKQMMEK